MPTGKGEFLSVISFNLSQIVPSHHLFIIDHDFYCIFQMPRCIAKGFPVKFKGISAVSKELLPVVPARLWLAGTFCIFDVGGSLLLLRINLDISVLQHSAVHHDIGRTLEGVCDNFGFLLIDRKQEACHVGKHRNKIIFTFLKRCPPYIS